jgi:Peptidase S80 family
MEQVYFTCTALPGDKKGILQKDENGYYTHPVGALDVFNSTGDFYTARGAKDLFEKSSHFMRRVQEGIIYGEEGHPAPLPGQSFQEFYRRALTIDEKSICCHFSEFWLDFESSRDATGRPIVVIMAKVRPHGPFAASLQSSLDNPKVNTCFSIRSVTDDKMVGNTLERRLKQIVTFDHVVESGISVARKFKSPVLESYVHTPITRDDLLTIMRKKDKAGIPAMEAAMDQASALLGLLGWTKAQDNRPAFMSW